MSEHLKKNINTHRHVKLSEPDKLLPNEGWFIFSEDQGKTFRLKYYCPDIPELDGCDLISDDHMCPGTNPKRDSFVPYVSKLAVGKWQLKYCSSDFYKIGVFGHLEEKYNSWYLSFRQLTLLKPVLLFTNQFPDGVPRWRLELC